MFFVYSADSHVRHMPMYTFVWLAFATELSCCVRELLEQFVPDEKLFHVLLHPYTMHALGRGAHLKCAACQLCWFSKAFCFFVLSKVEGPWLLLCIHSVLLSLAVVVVLVMFVAVFMVVVAVIVCRNKIVAIRNK